jgi:hypothetical protein
VTIVPRLALTAALLGVLAIFPPATKQGCPANASEWAYPDCDDGNYITGYWWHSESWVPGLIRNDSQFVNLPPVMRGRAVWYAAGIMEATAEVRGLSLDGYIDGVASMSCADIGQAYWISRMETAPEQPLWEGPFLVVDCPQLDDVYGIIVGREEVIEVGWRTAHRWADGPPPPGGWQVLASRLAPMDSMPPTVVLSTWFPPQAEFYARALEVTLDPNPLYRNQNGVVSWRIDGLNWVSFSPPGPFQVPVITATEPQRERPAATPLPAAAISSTVIPKEDNAMDPKLILVALLPFVPALLTQVITIGVGLFGGKKPSKGALQWIVYGASVGATIYLNPVPLPVFGEDPVLAIGAVLAFAGVVSSGAQVYYDKWVQPVLGGIDKRVFKARSLGLLAPKRTPTS